MKADGMTLWQRMIHAAAECMDWDGNSTEYGLAWCEVEVDDPLFGIHRELEDLVSIEPGERAPYAIVTENGVGQVEVITFEGHDDFRKEVRGLQRLYDLWLDDSGEP